MKNYRQAAPLLMVALVALAIYARITQLQDKEAEYLGYIENAKQYREDKIYVDAINEYFKASEVANSIELCKEIADTYKEKGIDEEIIEWGENMIETYPQEIYFYEYLIDYYREKEDYETCFELYDITQKREIYSSTLTANMNAIMYEYETEVGDFLEVSEYIEDFCYGLTEEGYTYIKHNGEPLFTYKYKQAGDYFEGVAPVKDLNGEFYFIDIDGNRKLNIPQDIEVTRLGSMSEDLYTVGTEGKVYFANREGQIVLGPYEDATTINYEIAGVKQDGKWYLVNNKGERISEDSYEGFVTGTRDVIYRNNVIYAKTAEGYVIIDGTGKKVSKEIFEDARHFIDYSYNAVKVNGLWGFADNTGKIMLEPKYEDARSFSNGLAAVKINGLWGYIDEHGDIVIEPVFEDAKSFNKSGYAFVKEDDFNDYCPLRLTRKTY